jgi:hypothetical protein
MQKYIKDQKKLIVFFRDLFNEHKLWFSVFATLMMMLFKLL